MTDIDASRLRTFSRVFNLRDVGGLPAEDGAVVKAGRLYRSDSLHGLGEEDRAAFGELGIRTVLDLRRPSELERDGRVPDWDGLVWRHNYLVHREWSADNPYSADLDLARYLADRYADMARESADGLAAAVATIADPAQQPVVVHCVAGKDRTGVVVALVLALLGTPDEDIATDYALSTEGLARYVEWVTAQGREVFGGDAKSMPLNCPPEAMRWFLDELRAEHGTVEAYLTKAGLDPAAIESLRATLL